MIKPLKKVMKEKDETGSDSLKSRIARLSLILGQNLAKTKDQLQATKIAGAITILNQAYLVSDSDEALALRLFTQARVVARKAA